MSLAEQLRDLDTDARILTFDVETQRAIVETFSLFTKFIHHDRVIVPTRLLCFSARWHGDDKSIFKSAWDENAQHVVDPAQYERMCRVIWNLLDEADVVITYNGDRFDLQWVEAECARLGMGRPKPYRSVDLIKIAKRRFKAGLMNLRLDWSARSWLRDGKIRHGESDLWHDIRYGTRAQQRVAQRLMKQYCEHDTALTERLFDVYLPWVNVNLALHRHDPFDETLRCTKCGSSELHLDGYVHLSAFSYHAYRCKKCGSVSRGKRAKITTELRSVT